MSYCIRKMCYILICVILCSCSSASETQSTKSSEEAILGASYHAFDARYGTPNSLSDDETRSYGVPDDPDKMYVLVNFKTKTQRVWNIHFTSDAVLGKNKSWTKSEDALQACKRFIPHDSVYKRKVDVPGVGSYKGTTEIEYVYFSPILAKKFDRTMFSDEHMNASTPGTFAIVLSMDTSLLEDTGKREFLFCGVSTILDLVD